MLARRIALRCVDRCRERWTNQVEEYNEQIKLLVGDVFLSASCVSYFGAFDSVYRQKITTIWRDGCVEKNIPCS